MLRRHRQRVRSRNNTNVVGTFDTVLRDDDQVAFYDGGVSTVPCLGRTLGLRVGTLLGKAFGYGLVDNVEDGYPYPMDTFVPGDNEPMQRYKGYRPGVLAQRPAPLAAA